MRSYHLTALIFSLFAGLTGLLLSYHNAVSTGPMIVLVRRRCFSAPLPCGKKAESAALSVTHSSIPA